MKIDHVYQRDKTKDLQEQTKVEKSVPEKGAEKGVESGKQKTDSVIISEQARSLQRTESEMEILKKRLEGDPSIREDKVIAAKAKIDSGSLLSGEVVDKTAEAIMRSNSLADIIKGKDLITRFGAEGEEVGESRQAKLDEVRQRMDEGFYNSPEVTEEIAGNILDDLLG
jgi:anti-sigma28 factor (negative regulator of flagellin synthesis)